MNTPSAGGKGTVRGFDGDAHPARPRMMNVTARIRPIALFSLKSMNRRDCLGSRLSARKDLCRSD